MNRNLVRSTRRWLLAAVLALVAAAPSHAQSCFDGFCSNDSMSGSRGGLGCGSHSCGHCPPPLAHCVEGAPKIRVRVGCPKPICNPCTQPGWGYHETCWTPWPWQPNYAHCPVTPPAATMAYGGQIGGYYQQGGSQHYGTPGHGAQSYAPPEMAPTQVPMAPPFPPVPTQQPRPPVQTTPAPTPLPNGVNMPPTVPLPPAAPLSPTFSFPPESLRPQDFNGVQFPPR